MDSSTAREKDCPSMISEVLWIIHLCRRGSRDDNFERGGTEKEKIIGARYWGLKTETPKITRNQTVTPLNEVLSIEI